MPKHHKYHWQHDDNLIRNGNFEKAAPDLGDDNWEIVEVRGWTNTGDGGIELWEAPYPDVAPPSENAKGPNNLIETDSDDREDVISQQVDAKTGKTYELTFDFASRGATAGEGNTTDSFQVWWNGACVGTFDPTSAETWTQATITVTGAAGLDTLEIRETGANDTYGALIDNVSLTKVKLPPPNLVENGDFEEESPDLGDDNWGLVNVEGWSNTGDGAIELWQAPYPDVAPAGDDGNYLMETDSDERQDRISQTFDLQKGAKYELTFDFASRGATAGANNTTDKFQVWWNGKKVATFDPNDATTWEEASLILKGKYGPETLEFREAGANDGLGALIDNVSLTRVCHKDDWYLA